MIRPGPGRRSRNLCAVTGRFAGPGAATSCFPVEFVQPAPGHQAVVSPALGLTATMDHDDRASTGRSHKLSWNASGTVKRAGECGLGRPGLDDHGADRAFDHEAGLRTVPVTAEREAIRFAAAGLGLVISETARPSKIGLRSGCARSCSGLRMPRNRHRSRDRGNTDALLSSDACEDFPEGPAGGRRKSRSPVNTRASSLRFPPPRFLAIRWCR